MDITNLIYESIIGAMTGLIVAFGTAFVVMRNVIRRNRALEVLVQEGEIEESLSACLSRTTCDRAIIYRMHNGGEPFSVGSAKYITILHEPEDSLHPYVKNLYNQRPASRELLVLIQEIATTAPKVVYRSIDDLPSSELKRNWIASGITAGIFFLICTTERGVRFGALSTTGDPAEFTNARNFSILEAQIARLRLLHEKAIQRRILI